MVFRKNSVRERTSSSDLILSDLRKEPGIKTVYTVADNRPAAFMTRFFTDMLIKTSLVAAQEEVLPLLFVFDDFEILPKFGQLHEGLIYGAVGGFVVYAVNRQSEKHSRELRPRRLGRHYYQHFL